MRSVFYKIFVFLPYLIVFLTSLYTPSDPDLGWHLKYGEYFWQHGQILRENTFAVMMPGYHWANGSWLTDVITYSAFHVAGFLGLSLLSALVVTATFYFVSKFARLTLWDEVFLFPLLLYLESAINSVSFRGQQLSLLFVAGLFWIIRSSLSKRKLLWLTVPLFFVWANVHEEFLLGLGVFFVWMVGFILQANLAKMRSIREVWKAFDIRKYMELLVVFVLCCLVTVINPFGIGIHLDALSHFGNPLLKDIAEYLPFPVFSQQWWNEVVVAMLIVMGVVFLFFNRKLSDKFPFLVTAIFLLILSFGVRRYAWPAYYLSLPFLQPLPTFFKPDGKKMTVAIAATLLGVLLIFTIQKKLPLSKFTTYSWDDYCGYSYLHCSPNSAEFLIDHHLTHNLFSLYGWGGWLVWNYPQIKPTIDGRMHLWRSDNGYSGFADYFGYEQSEKEITNTNYDVVYMSPDKPLYKHMIRLVNQGSWVLRYQDDYAGIFVRNK